MASPFDWRASGPSIVRKDARFRVTADGLTVNESASRNVRRRTAKTGRNPGTLYGLSDVADTQIRLRKGRAG